MPSTMIEVRDLREMDSGRDQTEIHHRRASRGLDVVCRRARLGMWQAILSKRRTAALVLLRHADQQFLGAALGAWKRRNYHRRAACRGAAGHALRRQRGIPAASLL